MTNTVFQQNLLRLVLAQDHRDQHAVEKLRGETRWMLSGAGSNHKHIRSGLIRIVNNGVRQSGVRGALDNLEFRVHRANLLQLLGVVIADDKLLLRGRNFTIGKIHQLQCVTRVHQAHQDVKATLGDIAVVHGHQIGTRSGRN